MKVSACIFVAILATCHGQRYARYYDQNYQQYQPNGNYYPEDGQYIHDDSGRYIPDDSGKYIHIDNPYLHQMGPDWAESQISNRYIKPVTPKRYGTYDDSRIKIIRLNSDVKKTGFKYDYETENEIFGEERAKLQNKGTDQEGLRSEGFYRYTGPDNVIYEVQFTADENGFIPKADHLPLALQRALNYHIASSNSDKK